MDFEMPQAFQQQTRTAKKQHTCCECKRSISVGEKLQDDLIDMMNQRDALAAQVEVLSQHIGSFSEIEGAFDAARWENKSNEILKNSPQQHLREIQAEAILDAVSFGRNQAKYFLLSAEDILQQIELHAAKVRQGEPA